MQHKYAQTLKLCLFEKKTQKYVHSFVSENEKMRKERKGKWQTRLGVCL